MFRGARSPPRNQVRALTVGKHPIKQSECVETRIRRSAGGREKSDPIDWEAVTLRRVARRCGKFCLIFNT